MAIKRVHLPEMTLSPAEVGQIKAAVKEVLRSWLNHSTEKEKFYVDQIADAVTPNVLAKLVEMGRQKNAA